MNTVSNPIYVWDEFDQYDNADDNTFDIAKLSLYVMTSKLCMILIWRILASNINMCLLTFKLNKHTKSQLIEAERRIYAAVNMPTFVQIMACHLIGAKPLPEPMQEYY